jgi:hypothetical protein
MRRIWPILVIVVVLVAVAIVGSMTLRARSNSLAGTTWKISMVDPAGKSAADTMTFEKGRFDSQSCHAYGFGTAAYTVARHANGLTFGALTRSAKQGTMNWQGRVQGSRISGSILLTPNQGREIRYAFSGKRA